MNKPLAHRIGSRALGLGVALCALTGAEVQAGPASPEAIVQRRATDGRSTPPSVVQWADSRVERIGVSRDLVDLFEPWHLPEARDGVRSVGSDPLAWHVATGVQSRAHATDRRVAPTPAPLAIPLPPAAWPALGTLAAVVVGMSAAKKRRRGRRVP
jgi:hypothetical protein